MTKLSDALYLAAETLDLSARQIAEQAKAAGYSLSNKTVSQYLAGRHAAKPDPGTLEALGHVLRIDVDRLHDLAGVPRQLGEYHPPTEASALSHRQRELVDSLIRELVASNAHDGALKQRDSEDFTAALMNDLDSKRTTVRVTELADTESRAWLHKQLYSNSIGDDSKLAVFVFDKDDAHHIFDPHTSLGQWKSEHEQEGQS